LDLHNLSLRTIAATLAAALASGLSRSAVSLCLFDGGNPMTTWMPEECSLLAVLYADGLSAAAIADRIGCSRNAVLGKVHRMRRDGVLAQRGLAAASALPFFQAEAKQRQLRKPTDLSGPIGPALEPPHRARDDAAAAFATSPRNVIHKARNDRTSPRREVFATMANTTRPCTLLELGRHNCRWPIGDPQDETFRFCGAIALDGCPYCRAHTALSLRRDAA
jgi:GcrA cell cycle regulator